MVLSGSGADMALLTSSRRRAADALHRFGQSNCARWSGDGLQITIEKAPGVKCERCWRYVPTVSRTRASAIAARRAGRSRQLVSAVPRHRAPELWLSAVIVSRDQVTKALVRAKLPLYDSVNVIPGMLDITHATNSGAAFGILNGVEFPYKAAVMVLVALVALAAVGLYAMTLPAEQRVARAGLALILGGACGNLIDRALAGPRAGFRRCLLARLSFLGLQRGRFRDYRRRGADAARRAGSWTCTQDCLTSDRSPSSRTSSGHSRSTPTASCWLPRIFSVFSSRSIARKRPAWMRGACSIWASIWSSPRSSAPSCCCWASTSATSARTRRRFSCWRARAACSTAV